MTFPLTLDDINHWRGFRNAASLIDFRSGKKALLMHFGSRFKAKAAARPVEDQEDEADAATADAGVEMNLVVSDEGGCYSAVYSVYSLSRAREAGLRAVACELNLGGVDFMIAETRREANGRPVLVAFGAVA
jgi:hypothetical protein